MNSRNLCPLLLALITTQHAQGAADAPRQLPSSTTVASIIAAATPGSSATLATATAPSVSSSPDAYDDDDLVEEYPNPEDTYYLQVSKPDSTSKKVKIQLYKSTVNKEETGKEVGHARDYELGSYTVFWAAKYSKFLVCPRDVAYSLGKRIKEIQVTKNGEIRTKFDKPRKATKRKRRDFDSEPLYLGTKADIASKREYSFEHQGE